MQGVFLRLARRADLTPLIAFCRRQHAANRAEGRPLEELNALLQGHFDTVIVAIQHDVVVGVALCGVTKRRARLLELIVTPGPTCVPIERRLIRRSLRNLRSLGLGTLHFGDGQARGPVVSGAASHTSGAPASVSDSN